MKRTILTLALGLSINLSGSMAYAWGDWGLNSLWNQTISTAADMGWGSYSGSYGYEDNNGVNAQFTNGNTVTTLSLGRDGSSSAAITNYNDQGQAQNSTFYNSSGQDIGAALYNNGVMTTYNACGVEGAPGQACTWTNEETGEQVRVDGW